MNINKVSGMTLPLRKENFTYEEWDSLTSTLGKSAIELKDIANVLSEQNLEWIKSNKEGLPNYYKDLSDKLIKIQQALFGYNVTGNDDVGDL